MDKKKIKKARKILLISIFNSSNKKWLHNILIIFYLVVFPTMAAHFSTRNEWIMKREQAQPLINKIFSEMEKGSHWFEQLRFLILCRKKEKISKRMCTKISGKLATLEYGQRLKKNHEMKIWRKNISELHSKKGGSDKKYLS